MRDLMSPDEVKQAAERLLDEVKIHVAEYGCDPKKPSFNLDILVVANAALTAAAELAAARTENERLREVLRMIDYVAMTIYEATSEEGAESRARDIARRAQAAFRTTPATARPGQEGAAR